MVFWARRVLRTLLMRLIRCGIVLAVVHTVAHLRLWNASTVETSKFTVFAWSVGAAFLIRAVLAVVVVIAFP